MVTIKDVAREAGVAISTVSNVINNVGNVSKGTKQRVLDVVERLQYVPNMNARSLKANKGNTVGLFLSSIQGDYYRMLTQAIHIQCKIAGFMLNIYVSNENTSEEIYGMIISSGVEGAIIMNESLGSEYIARIERTGLPMVFLERECCSEKISSIVIDNYIGAEMAMEYLVSLGHRRIGYIHGVESRDDKERYRAYLDVMEKYGLCVDSELLLNGFFEEVIALSEVKQLLLKKVALPDAFFCANDEMACGCIRALSSFGVRVPEQVSVIGFDNINLAQYYTPALSTVENPVTELGDKSALELFRLIRREGMPEGVSIKLAPSLVVRESCSRALQLKKA
ncbi:MAG: LacI family transcriptional regulator [Lachnospiraceae bacterium]|nr:LacI family transcriptional regulator [Lachnospiraceae bacterium]